MRFISILFILAVCTSNSISELTIDFIGYHNATRSTIYSDSGDNDQGGMMMVFIRNTGTVITNLTEWRINGTNAATLVSNGTIQWQRIWPKTLAPGQIAVAQAKALNTPIKSGVNVTVQVFENSGSVSASAILNQPLLRLGSIVASQDMKTVYLFVRNTDTVSYTIQDVWLNDLVTSRCTFVGSPTVNPSAVGIIKIAFDQPIESMTQFAIRVQAIKPDSTVIQVGGVQRLLKPFIAQGTWSSGLATDESGQQYAKNLQINIAAGSEDLVALNKRWGNYHIGGLAGCRTDGIVNVDRVNSAKANPAFTVWMLADEPDNSGSEPRQNFVDHNEQMWQLDPNTPTYLNLCKNYRFAQYCHIPDIISMDHYVMYAPNAIPGTWVTRIAEFEEAFEYAKVLKENCEPKMMWVWPQLVKSDWSNQPTDWGVNLQFWTQIMMGAKGYTWFRYAPGNESSYPSQIAEAIQVGKEFAQVRNIIYYGETANIVSVSNNKVRSRAILNEEAMVVILTNYNYTKSGFPWSPSYSINPSTTNVSVTVPDWIPLEDVYRVTANGRTSASYSIVGRTVSFSNIALHQDSFVYVIGKTDTTPPDKVKGLHFAQVTSPTEFVLAWQNGWDNYGVAGYKVYQNGVEIADVKQPLYKTTSGVNIAGEWTVRAYDSAGNLSQPCLSVSYSRIALLFNNADDMEGCYFNNNSVNISIEDGTLKFDLNGTNTYLYFPQVLFDASDYRYLRARLANGTNGTGMRIRWITPTDPTYNNTKSVILSFPANQPQLQEYVLDLSTFGAWTGQIMNPYLIPAINQSVGTTEIDYVIFQSANPTFKGDVNSTGFVDLHDFSILSWYYGLDVLGWQQGDLTADRKVTLEDLEEMALFWLNSY